MTVSRPFLAFTPRAFLGHWSLVIGHSTLSLLHFSARAISVGSTENDTSAAAELASFTVLDGFEVSLFASEKDGVVNPISIRWDEHGRLWVLTTTSYPQPKPGEEVDDKILILEDTDHDGKCDKVTVFADHLRMPMGLELAPSVTWPAPPKSGDAKSPPRACAAYVGEGEKLWLMRDTDGDGRADVREVVFSGFGTGDMHQGPNSFTWTPDGALMFSQGLHCYSNITTAYGGRRLYGAGFWMYRPLSGKLTPYPTGFPLNAWGTVYDDNGQPFSVAGAAGMFWTTPLLISTEHLIEGRALPNNGQMVKQGMLKYCGIDIPRNAHWPAGDARRTRQRRLLRELHLPPQAPGRRGQPQRLRSRAPARPAQKQQRLLPPRGCEVRPRKAISTSATGSTPSSATTRPASAILTATRPMAASGAW